jgi:hypothetical protein
LELPRAASRVAAPCRASLHSCSCCSSCHLSSRLQTMTTFVPLGNFPAGAQRIQLKSISICWCTAFDSGSELQARRVSANAELKRLMMRLLRCLCHTFVGVVQISRRRAATEVHQRGATPLLGTALSDPSAGDCPCGNRGGSLGKWRIRGERQCHSCTIDQSA